MSSPTRYGVDAEVHQKIKNRYDPEEEKKALQWIQDVTGNPVSDKDFYSVLKNGVVLCQLINTIRPGSVKHINLKPTNVLAERENIQAYIDGCAALGVPSQELFVISDLHEKKYLPGVLLNIYALGRQAQVTPGFNGPRLGVKYTFDAERRENITRRKTLEAEALYQQSTMIQDYQMKRRMTLEAEKLEQTVKKQEEDDLRARKRRMTRENITDLPEPAKKMTASDKRYARQDAEKKEERRLSISPVRFGMDHEIEQKMKAKYDVNEEEKVMDWIEIVTGEPVDEFYPAIKSGVLLCQLINKIRPGTITKINTRPIPMLERENIQLYLNACCSLGVPSSDLFIVSDLYEKKNLGAVLQNLNALARVAVVRGDSIPPIGSKPKTPSMATTPPQNPKRRSKSYGSIEKEPILKKPEEVIQTAETQAAAAGCCSACTIL